MKLFDRIPACFFLLWMVSCTSFLEEDPKGQLSGNLSFTNKNDLESSIHALYKNVRNLTNGANCYAPAWAGDDLTANNNSDRQKWREFDQWNVSDNNGSMTGSETGSWVLLWKMVKAANYIINGVRHTPDVTEEQITFALGQAYYWRAYSYFYLVRNWGSVPKILEGEVDYTRELCPVEEIFDRIVSDLLEAEKLPVQYTTAPWAVNGRNVVVSKGAAQATLAYVYLTMAGWPLDKGAAYYTLAAGKAKEVIDGVEQGTYYYGLYDNYKDIHSKRYNYDNREVILAVYYSPNWQGDNGQAARGGINDAPNDPGTGGWAQGIGEIKFWKTFPEGPRKEATYYPKIRLDNEGTMVDWWDERRMVILPFFLKSGYTSNEEEYDYTKNYNDQSNGWNDQAHHIIRLSELYCWYAEAVGRSGQTTPLAIELLNKVRNRAEGREVNLYPAPLSPTELAEAAYNEHGWEIAGWYWGSLATRFYDQQRMNRVKDHFEFRKENPLIEVSPGIFRQEIVRVSGTWDERKMYAPIPGSDVLLNPNLRK
ncbi:MAG: RagB/SusD family nutrient uptake outer membrane protein [Tannerella sp.]|jgi:hypothetical protein|nr:RagB/SusD family nutrient uptake outer membrane protein [Tannerella sp.]